MITVFFVSLAFSIDAIVIEKEVLTRMGMGTTREQVTEYVTEKGIVREIVSEVQMNMMGRMQREKRKETEIIIYRKGGVLNYKINHGSKVFSKTELPAEMVIGMTMMIYLDCDPQRRCKVTEDKIKPTGEVKRIGKWKARKFVAEGIMPGMGPHKKVTQVLWFTKDSDLLLKAEKVKLKLLRSSVKGVKTKNPYIKDVVKVMDRIVEKHGSSVMTEVNMHGMVVKEVVKSVSTGSISEDKFAPPKGYNELGGFKIQVR